MGAWAVDVRNEWLDCFARAQAYNINAAVWAKLHIGDPGVDGTANPAAETTRKEITFGSAAADGAIANTVAVEWSSVSTTETYTHVSLWSLVTGGVFLGSDDITSTAVTAGDTFRLPIGDVDLTIV